MLGTLLLLAPCSLPGLAAAGPRPGAFDDSGVYDEAADPTVASIINEHRTASEPPADRAVNRSLRMTKAAANAWAALTLSGPNASRYFEWGSGGSTEGAAWAALNHHVNVFSVDSSQEWFASLRKDSGLIRKAEMEGSLELLFADVGAVGAWGMPDNWEQRGAEEQTAAGRAYAEAPIEAAGGDFGAVLIDGRWRLACGLAALKHVTPDSRVMVHDFYTEPDGARPSGRFDDPHAQYKVLLDWYDLHQRANELAVLKPRPESCAAARRGDANYTEALSTAYHIARMETNLVRYESAPANATHPSTALAIDPSALQPH